MSRSHIVDERYRLQAADLGSGPVRVLISGVSFQGVEELAPVLHFRGPVRKRLVLNATQRRELIALTHSSLCSDWVGRQVELRPIRSNQQAAITILAPTRPQARLIEADEVGRQGYLPVRTVLLLLLLGLLMAFAFWLEQATDPFRLLFDLFG
jgi:hypothetical protein